MSDKEEFHGASGAQDPPGEKVQKETDDALRKQKQKDLLLEQERMRRWIEDDEPLPVKMACKLSQHIVAKPENRKPDEG